MHGNKSTHSPCGSSIPQTPTAGDKGATGSGADMLLCAAKYLQVCQTKPIAIAKANKLKDVAATNCRAETVTFCNAGGRAGCASLRDVNVVSGESASELEATVSVS